MDIGSLTGTVGIDDQLTGALTTLAGKVKSFAEDFDGVMGGLAIGAGVVATAILGTVVSITKLGEEGSRILGVENAFDKLAEAAGTTGDALRGSLMEGVKGTADDMDLMRSTAKLLGSGMQLTTDQALLMGSAARELGKATGTDAVQGLDMMSTALTTGRTRQLQQQIGLIDLVAGEQKFADSLGVTVSELSAAGLLEGKRIAILDATQAYLDRLGISELSFAEKVKQGWVAIEEWGDTLAKTVATSTDVNDALDAVGKALGAAFGSESQSLMDSLVDGINAFARGVTAAVPYVVSFGQAIKTVWDFLADNMGTIVDAAKVVGAFGAAWLVWTVGGALVTGVVAGFTAITASITTVTVAIAANPLGAAAVAAVAAGLAISHYAQSTADAGLAAQVAGAQQDVMNRAIAAGDAALKDLEPSAKNAAAAAKYLGEVGRIVGDGIEDENAKLNDSSEFLKDNKAAVGALIDTILGEGKALKTVQEAFTTLYDAGELYGDTLLRMQPELDKLTKAHIALSAAQKDVYQQSVSLTQSLNDQDQVTLAANGVTLDYIVTQKEHGLTMQNIASLNGVTVIALTNYETKLRDVRSFEDESNKSAEASWNEYAKIVEADLAVSSFDQAKMAIQQWYLSQVQALDQWAQHEKEKYPEQTTIIVGEYEKRLAALNAIDDAKLAHLDLTLEQANTTSKAYYDRQAELAQAEYATAQTMSDKMSDAQLQAFKTQADQLQIAANNWTQWAGAGQAASLTVMSGMTTVTGGVQQMGTTLTSTMKKVTADCESTLTQVASDVGGFVTQVGDNLNGLFVIVGHGADDIAAKLGTVERQMSIVGGSNPSTSAALSDVMAIVNQTNIGQMMRAGTTNVGVMNEYEATINRLMAERGFSAAPISTLPSHEFGGPITTTGPAVVHAGEYVIPKDGALVSGGGGGGGDIIINAQGLYMSVQQLTDAISEAQFRRSGIKMSRA